MTTLDDLFGVGALQAEIDAGHVRVSRSGDGLSIYNYTEVAQYGHHWNPVTLRCRGLIADDETGDIIAWPFPKFFNHSEHGHGNPWAPDLPTDEEFTVYDKVDGSLGIIFRDARQKRWRAASRGSFNSEQAQWAQARIDQKDAWGNPVTARLNRYNTYLAEIVYPENRIVVNHSNKRDLVLLGVYDLWGGEWPNGASGHAVEWLSIGSVVRSWSAIPLDLLVEFAGRSADITGTVRSGADMEGYVLRYNSGLRVKVKLADYVRLHAVLTGMNERTIWEVISQGGDLDSLLETVPDEFADWANSVATRLRAEHDQQVATARAEYQSIRRAFAAEAVKSPMSALLFRLYDGKSIDELAWKSCKPSGLRTFSLDEDG